MTTAVANKIEVIRATSIRLPGGDTEGDRRAQINPKFLTPIHMVENNDEGQCVNVEIGELPLGTRELYVQHRMCGDFYCFIHASKQVSAIGDTPRDAFKNALRIAT